MAVSLLITPIIWWSLLTLVSAWVLKRKNRRFWRLLILFSPPFWGYLGLMFLKNKSQLPSKPLIVIDQDKI
jgi:hypothetical protein